LNEGDTDVVYEIDSDDSDIAPERPAESAQVELSTLYAYSLTLKYAAHLLLQTALRRIGILQSMYSSDAPLVSNMSTLAESMSSNAQPPTARGSMAEMCVAFLIQVTRSQPVVFVDMRKCAGVTKQLVLLIILEI
jgi:hypothetical protein